MIIVFSNSTLIIKLKNGAKNPPIMIPIIQTGHQQREAQVTEAEVEAQPDATEMM